MYSVYSSIETCCRRGAEFPATLEKKNQHLFKATIQKPGGKFFFILGIILCAGLVATGYFSGLGGTVGAWCFKGAGVGFFLLDVTTLAVQSCRYPSKYQSYVEKQQNVIQTAQDEKKDLSEQLEEANKNNQELLKQLEEADKNNQDLSSKVESLKQEVQNEKKASTTIMQEYYKQVDKKEVSDRKLEVIEEKLKENSESQKIEELERELKKTKQICEMQKYVYKNGIEVHRTDLKKYTNSVEERIKENEQESSLENIRQIESMQKRLRKLVNMLPMKEAPTSKLTETPGLSDDE